MFSGGQGLEKDRCLRQDVEFFNASDTHITKLVNSVYNYTLVIHDPISENA